MPLVASIQSIMATNEQDLGRMLAEILAHYPNVDCFDLTITRRASR